MNGDSFSIFANMLTSMPLSDQTWPDLAFATDDQAAPTCLPTVPPLAPSSAVTNVCTVDKEPNGGAMAYGSGLIDCQAGLDQVNSFAGPDFAMASLLANNSLLNVDPFPNCVTANALPLQSPLKSDMWAPAPAANTQQVAPGSIYPQVRFTSKATSNSGLRISTNPALLQVPACEPSALTTETLLSESWHSEACSSEAWNSEMWLYSEQTGCFPPWLVASESVGVPGDRGTDNDAKPDALPPAPTALSNAMNSKCGPVRRGRQSKMSCKPYGHRSSKDVSRGHSSGKSIHHCTEAGCNYMASHRNALDRHLQTVHGDARPYKCPLSRCQQAYMQKYERNRHIKTSHTHSKKELITREEFRIIQEVYPEAEPPQAFLPSSTD